MFCDILFRKKEGIGLTEMYPAYYGAFHCTAGACRHNCCIGWEIDIDDKSAARYAALPGAFGERVRAAIEPGEPPHFRLDGAERCAMLREDNLCEIQRTLGESALCDICRDHPRYRVFLPGRTETGLGLCCEEAARLLLAQTEKATLCGTVSEAPPRETVELLLFRQKLLDAAQNRRLSPGGRMQKILTLSGASLPRRTARAWAAFFASLEALEPGWTEALSKLDKPVDYAGFRTVSAAWETEYEQLLVYFLLRHLLADGGHGTAQRAAFAVLSTAMLYALGAAARTENGALTFGERAELARLWSANVEYSEENMRAVLGELT